MTDEMLKEILTRTKVIAVVGASANPARPSHYVSVYLQQKGFRVIPVNPGLAGTELFGERAFARLSDIPAEIPVDMVDIFRRSETVPAIVVEALAQLPALRTVWMQIGVQNAEAAALAESRGIDVVQNRCPKMDYPRLIG